ncbi:hypothetical protein DPM19_33655 [Actinomadura craniellae]|uniref:DUF397 domain-containing protein n=1 Tax=Actinomadura craniellae TaxID=2231787 RepID=A0A365GVH3_9ACTN|nr:hypothetical protein DPM19_33655 [Actinomadura craniellae]
MNQPDPAQPTWRKSTHSGGGNECIELADLGDTIAIRDSKNPEGPLLHLTPGEADAFLAELKGRGDGLGDTSVSGELREKGPIIGRAGASRSGEDRKPRSPHAG